jgi:hypothetical protein
MELTYVTIVVLACMIFVLAGMVGYLYWQQTRMLQHLQSLAMAFATHLQPQPEQLLQPESEAEADEEDDRVSVKEEVEVVEGPPKEEEKTLTATSAAEDDVDDIQSKTASELRDILTKKGIPFGKRDSKAVLLQLLQATST